MKKNLSVISLFLLKKIFVNVHFHTMNFLQSSPKVKVYQSLGIRGITPQEAN